MDTLNHDFAVLLKQFEIEIEKVRITKNEIIKKYLDCKNFDKTISIPNHGAINDRQKEEELRLLNDLKNAIKRWQESVGYFNEYCKRELNLI